MDRPPGPSPETHRTAELGIEVQLIEDAVVLTGVVPTEEVRQAVAIVVAELVDDRQIRNQIAVADLSPPAHAEHLP